MTCAGADSVLSSHSHTRPICTKLIGVFVNQRQSQDLVTAVRRPGAAEVVRGQGGHPQGTAAGSDPVQRLSYLPPARVVRDPPAMGLMPT